MKGMDYKLKQSNFPCFLKISLLIIIQICLLLDQFLYNHFYKELQITFDPTLFMTYKWISMLILGVLFAIFIAKCNVPILLLSAFVVLNIIICVVNIPLLSFISRIDTFILFIGILIFKIIDRVINKIRQ